MSGGHYPPSYHHIQSPQEFISPRHRLPAIPPEGPTSAHAHSSLASCPSWTNKHNFSNYHENSSLYTQTTAKNYSPSTRSYYNEESGWSERNSHMNSSHRANSNDDKSRITYSNDVQQESMDLSSAAQVPSTGTPTTKLPTNDATTTVPVNGSPAAPSCDEKPSLNGSPDDKNTPEAASKTEPVSVIAANPLREIPSQDAENQVKAKPEAPALKSNDTAEPTKPKHEQSITADRVESILETMFHSDTKSSTCTTSSSVTVNTPPCKTLDLRGESVEKILKSPSPVHGDHLESDLGLNSSEFESTRDSSTMNSLVTDVTVTNDTKPTKDDHDNSRKPSDDSDIEKSEKLVSNKQSDNQKIPTNSSRIENLGLVDDCDTPPVKSKSNTEPATDLSSVKSEPKEAPNSSKKDTTASAKKSDTNKEVPAKSKNRKEEITYVQVESELEKMFAGIEDISMDPVKSIQADDSSKRNPAPKTTNSSSHSAANDIQAKPVKKKSSKKSKSASTKKDAKKHSINSKDTSTDSVSFKRVPVIHVEGSKENPINVQIINSIKLEEDDISDAKTAAKRKQGKCDKANKRLAAAYSVKNYDPEASDDTWMCIFCKLSAHSPGLAGEPTGDLFGPYFIQTCSDSDSKRHSRKTDHLTEPIKKKQKRSVSIESNHASTNLSEHNKSMEIWAHENCFIWASGIHLVGSKLVGLEEAVFEALRTICAHCGEKGASIGCRARHCKSFVHYSCALYTGWNLNPETFIAVCYLHKGTKTQ